MITPLARRYTGENGFAGLCSFDRAACRFGSFLGIGDVATSPDHVLAEPLPQLHATADHVVFEMSGNGSIRDFDTNTPWEHYEKLIGVTIDERSYSCAFSHEMRRPDGEFRLVVIYDCPEVDALTEKEYSVASWPMLCLRLPPASQWYGTTLIGACCGHHHRSEFQSVCWTT